jgi:signal transduction histidine kinase
LTGEPQGLVVLVTALGFACLLAIRVRYRRARTIRSLNRALHELRRPLQALALVSPGGTASGDPATAGFRRVVAGPALHDPVRQAIRALAELDRTINGGSEVRPKSELVAVKLMADGCVRRWQPRARLAGCQLALRWSGQDVLVRGDGLALAGALENLILNAIEHGGDRIEVSGAAHGHSVLLAVTDTGPVGRSADREAPRQGEAARHGHGLEIVGETVRQHGGRFERDFGPSSSRVSVTLPLARVGAVSGRKVRVNW